MTLQVAEFDMVHDLAIAHLKRASAASMVDVAHPVRFRHEPPDLVDLAPNPANLA
jgi:hypothetical protein